MSKTRQYYEDQIDRMFQVAVNAQAERDLALRAYHDLTGKWLDVSGQKARVITNPSDAEAKKFQALSAPVLSCARKDRGCMLQDKTDGKCLAEAGDCDFQRNLRREVMA